MREQIDCLEEKRALPKDWTPDRIDSELVCPFFCSGKGTCQALAEELTVELARRGICRSDDYDGCPRYLAYLLRRMRPNRTDHDWLDAV